MNPKSNHVICTNLELEAIARHSIFRGGEFEVGLASLRSDHLVALRGEVLVQMDALY